MNKKFISIVLSLLLIINAFSFVSVIAAESESQIAEDVITYPDTTTILFEEDFESGDVGSDTSSLIPYMTQKRVDGTSPIYSSSRYAYGVGGNNTQVGHFFDKGYTKDERYTVSGEIDESCVLDANRNIDGVYTTKDILTNQKYVTTKFRYYNAAASKSANGNNIYDTMTVMHAQSSGIISSTTPQLTLSPTSAVLNFRDKDDYSSLKQTITGLQPNKWYDVIFETVYDPATQRATSTVTIDGKTMSTYISFVAPTYAPDGYDPPGRLAFTFNDYAHGGRFYIDDIVVTGKTLPSENFKKAVDELSFDNVVRGDTGNTQESVTESWEDGLITSYSRAGSTYNIQWTTSDSNIISAEGVVSRRSYPQKVTLTAKIIESDKMYATRKFEVIVAPTEGASVETILSEYAENSIKEELFSDEVTSESNRITKDIKPLPTRDDLADIDISWSEPNPPGYINKKTGEVTRPSYSAEDVEVTLTATLSKDGSAPVTKDIKYTVVKNPDPALVIDDVMENLIITDEEYNKITDKLNLPSEYNGVQIHWDTDGHSQIAQDGTVTSGDTEVTGTITATFSFDGTQKTKDYTLTVYPSVLKMIEIDIDSIDITGWDALTSDFYVPQVGEKYGSIFSWSSTNDNVIEVGENGLIKVKRPPNNETDKKAKLFVTAKIGKDSTDSSFEVTVLKQADDRFVAQEAAKLINFDYIRGDGNTQDAVVKNLSLPTGFTHDNELTVEWKSSNDLYVKTNGEVIRPLPGEQDVDITLTARVYKNNAYSDSEVISFTVKALSGIEELLQEAKNSLIFASISSEEIDSVTQNLTLPSEGKYGTTIVWTSDSKFLSVSGTQGIVTRPSWEDDGGAVVLKATLSYTDGDLTNTVDKTFNITIPDNDTFIETEVMFNEDFNDWTSEYKFQGTTDKGNWMIPDTNVAGSRANVCQNPDGSGNTAIFISRENESLPAAYLSYTSIEAAEANSVSVGMDFYLEEGFEGIATIEIRSNGSDMPIALIRLNGTNSTIDVDTANNSATITTLELQKGIFKKGEWNTLKFDINTKNKRFHMYLDDACITENGFVTNKSTGDPFVTTIGIPFSYSGAISVKGIRWITDKGTLYLDNVYIDRNTIHTEDQKIIADIWEEDFVSTIDYKCIKKGFTLPQWPVTTKNGAYCHEVDGITIIPKFSNESILNPSGLINIRVVEVVKQITPVTLTVTFDNGKSVYKRKYVCLVYPPDEVDSTISDADAVAADLNSIVSYITKNYNLTNLKTNINFEGITYKNGSTVKFESSNKGVISDKGIITMKSEVQKATVKITAEKGSAKKSQTLEFIIGVRQQGAGGGGGGLQTGGGGNKPVYGENTTPQTGLKDENASENNSQGASVFKDVATDHWAYDQINYMVENKIMNGVGDGRIEPERTINREEFVKMLVMALGLDLKDTEADFTDVDANEWYAPYVATIKEKGLINGFEDGSFGIGQNISRQDLAVLIYRSSDLAKEDVKETFKDDAEIADYAKDAVYTLRDLGIINGKDEGKFDPAASATRAETATMLYKSIKAGLFE